MAIRTAIFGLLFAFVLGAAPPAESEKDEDLRTLNAAGIASDPTSLCDLVRRLAPSADDDSRISALIQKLSAADFNTRKQASLQLAAFGRRALPALQAAQASNDAEVAHRAQACVRQIERETRPNVVIAAARVLGRSSAEDAAAALLTGLIGADDAVAQEISDALANLARKGGRTPTALAVAISDSHPLRRAAAAEAILRSQQPRSVATVRPLQNDSSPFVRFRVGVALAEAGERDGVGTVIASLPDLSIAQLFDADEFLTRIAGSDSPPNEPGDTPAQRREYHEAWQAWWSPRSSTFEVPASHALNRPDIALACITNDGDGSVVELSCGAAGTIRVLRRINNLVFPVAIAPLPRDRVLVCEFRGNRVTERDFTGKVHWEKQIAQPVAAQRVPGGGYFIAGRKEILCVNRDGTIRYRFDKENTAAAVRRSDKSIVVVTNVGVCQTLDESGKVTSSFPISRGLQFSTVQSLPGGRLLIPDYSEDRVIEYDATGQEVWSADFRRPNGACRLPNGRTLVSCKLDCRMGELDREGHLLRDYRPGENWRPWGAVPAR